MNRFVLMVSVGVMLILVPIGFVLYGYWDIHQPRLGAVGDGNQKFLTVPPVLIPLIGSLILGIGNIHAAIVYRKQNLTKSDKNEDDSLS